ncbi:universal stress protein [Anaeromyxobacter oryzae]|uniref:Universal stress protein n=1 Tax=Anaeromyxobacter oryzae TaxID=2918170 RepID=A0ABM7WS23_9BACT|nr:universal stress protein [Anaeromyxobacter oryzae]BDG02288.1 universal stress protein [Anaeromyxobacter oryzae]
MTTWKRICCPIDFSRESRAALEAAADLARRFEAGLAVVHVRDPGDRGDAAEMLATRDVLEGAPVETERQLAAWADAAERRSSTAVQSALLAGDPAQEIVRFARQSAVDVIVVGTHARSDRDRLVLGSVAAAVVREAPCTVVVVRDRAA